MTNPLTKVWDCFSVSFVVALTLAGLLLLGAWPVWQSLRARDWVPVECEITLAELTTWTSWKKTMPDYRFEASYQYEFNGQNLVSGRFRFRTASESPVAAFNLKQRYPVGTRTTCFVNPKHPHEAVLDRSVDGASWLYLFALLPASAGLFYLWRKRRAKKLVTA